MEKQRQNRNTDGRAGFTLLEIVVALVVFGILCAAAVVNWASFMRYQELRDSANAFHKELLAAKAKALEDGVDVKITYTSGNMEWKWDTENPATGAPVPNGGGKTVPLNKNVEVIPNPAFAGNLWKNGSSNDINIVVKPNNLEAFDSGSVRISSTNNKVKKYFIVQKKGNSIKPELVSGS